MRKLAAIFHFYRSIAFVNWTISVLCYWELWHWRTEHSSSLLTTLLCFKLFTFLPIWYLVSNIRAKQLYYYYNRQISKAALWLIPFSFDFLICVIGLCLIWEL